MAMIFLTQRAKSCVTRHVDFYLISHDTIKRKDTAFLPALKTSYASGEDPYAVGIY